MEFKCNAADGRQVRLKALYRTACLVGKPFTTYFKNMQDSYDACLFETGYVKQVFQCVAEHKLLTGDLAEYVGCNVFRDACGDILRAIYLAASRGHIVMLSWLHQKYQFNKLDVSAEFCQWAHVYINTDGFINALFVAACAAGHHRTAQWLLKKYPSVDIAQYINTACTEACQAGHLPTAQWLASLGVDMGKFKSWSFRQICYHGHLEVAQWVSEQFKLDQHVYDNAWQAACQGDQVKVAQWLERYCMHWVRRLHVESLFSAACKRNASCDMISYLGSQTDREYLAEYFTDTVLTKLCRNNSFNVIQWLLRNGIDEFIRTFSSVQVYNAAMVHACIVSAMQVVRLNMEKIRYFEPRTIRSAAILSGDMNMVLYLCAERILSIDVELCVSLFNKARTVSNVNTMKWAADHIYVNGAEDDNTKKLRFIYPTFNAICMSGNHCDAKKFYQQYGIPYRKELKHTLIHVCNKNYFKTALYMIETYPELKLYVESGQIFQESRKLGSAKMCQWLLDQCRTPIAYRF